MPHESLLFDFDLRLDRVAIDAESCVTIGSVDRALGVAIIVLGVMQSLSTFRFFERIDEQALWFFAGGMLLMLVGALTLLRLRHGAVAPGVRTLSTLSSLILALFWIGLYTALFEKFAGQPASFVGLLVIVAGAVVALLQERRSRRGR